MFIRGVVALHLFPWFSIFSWLLLLMSYVVFVNTWQKGGDLDEMWEYVGILFCFVLFRWSWNCFWKGEKIKFFDVSNLGGELVYIFVICFSLFILFYLYFSTHAFMHLLSVSGIHKLIQSCYCLHLQLMDSS